MTTVAAVHGALPPHRYRQEEITRAFEQLLESDEERELLHRVHASSGVESRYTALPIEELLELEGFGDANDRYLEHATRLGAEALSGALADAGLRPQDVDAIVLVSSTGVSTPSLDARIANRLGLRADITRVPMFGLGCVGGAAGLARLHDHLRGAPNEVAVLVAVELCSVTVQRDDRSPTNVVASALFGDGAAAVVAAGDDRAMRLHRPPSGPRIVRTRSRLHPDTERAMGWDVTSGGFTIVFDQDVPEIGGSHLREDVDGLLAEAGLSRAAVAAWVCHPGGPKVIRAIESTLELHDRELELTWRSMAQIGNISSPSVLHVLRDTLDKRPAAGTPGMMIAMGPGFSSELLLVEWI